MTNDDKKQPCSACRGPKSTLKCGICVQPICKSCTEFLPTDSFSYMLTVPLDITHEQYCPFCYTEKVQPVMRQYADTMRKAKTVFIIDKPRRRPLPLLRTTQVQLRIVDCKDREETLMRLAYMAAEQGFNSVIKVNVTFKTVRNAGYQSTLWQATGFPADLEPGKLERQTAEST